MTLDDQIADLDPDSSVAISLRAVCEERAVVTSRTAGYVSVRPQRGYIAAYFNRHFVDIAVAPGDSAAAAARLGTVHMLEKSPVTNYVRVDDVAARVPAVINEVLRALDWRYQSAGPVRSSEAVLGEDEFVAAMLDGATEYYLHDWADALLAAVVRSHGRTDLASRALIGLLRKVAATRRQGVDPFADYLEAPSSIIDLYERHGEALDELVSHHTDTLNDLLLDVGSLMYRSVEPPTWSALVAAGATRVRPEPPNDDAW